LKDLCSAKDRCAGRARNSEEARARILQAAREAFTGQSYDLVGMRQIASQAGYDKALVHRYFGSKEALFCAVLDSLDKHEISERPPTELARDLASSAVLATADDMPLTALLMMLRSHSSPAASDIARRHLETCALEPLASTLEGDDAHLRAGAAIALAIGVLLLAKVVKAPALTDVDQTRLLARITAMLETALEAPVKAGG
jgi:AcrR family transcriptional regulator